LGLPFLVVLLFVVAEFARVFYMAMGVASAARAGVQYGAQSYVKAIDNAGMTNAATNDGQNVSGLSVVPTHFCMCDGAQCSPASASPCILSLWIKGATFQQIAAAGFGIRECPLSAHSQLLRRNPA
jgi:hypothetical protein